MLALRNIFRSKLRNFLSILGVGAGISVFVASLSVSNGFKTQTREIMQSYRIDIAVQSKGAGNPIASRITLADCERLRRISGVSDVSSLVLGTMKTRVSPYFVIAGISVNEAALSKFSLVEGSPLSGGRREVMVGRLAAQQYGYHAGNKIVLVNDEVFTVAGIYSFGSRIMDGAVVLDIGDAQRLLKIDQYVSMVFIQVQAGVDPRQVIARINERFSDLSAMLSGDFTGQVRLFNTVELFSWVISMISFFTCCIVVMNTLFMAISERTKEIGILMAIGWSRFMIFRMILTEAVTICLMGGVLGNVIGFLFLSLLSKTKTVGLGWIPASLPSEIVLGSLGLSLLLGAVSAALPAFVASRMLPADALRYE